jgi:isocitrate dehydrogenase kinase/phosphatase
MEQATTARLLLYPASSAELVVQLGRLIHLQDLPWALIRRRYGAAIRSRTDQEIAATFYNSTIRRLRGTIGVDEEEEFLDLATPELAAREGLAGAALTGPHDLAAALDQALGSIGWRRWRDREGDARRIADRLAATIPEIQRGGRLEWLPTAFVRRQRAFLVGHLETEGGTTPFAISLVRGPEGITANAVVTGADDVSVVFGFTRSYFHVGLEAPRPVVGYLASLLPTKRLDELYTVIGYHRHGKREFYQALHQALADPAAKFEPIEGVPGLVMLAFVLRPLNAVFKVIRDRSAPPKQISRKEVMAKYEFVFRHEHGGRLADTQEFTGLSIPRSSFVPDVIAEIEQEAKEAARTVGDRVVFQHLYTERRMTPLDVYLRKATPEAARAAVIDFGRAIKDLAGLNLFPGDLLPKNFGVTRHGRIVFYDYDEISTLTDCRFRAIPAASRYEDEIAAEPWYSVGSADMFPEEWERFIRFPERLHAEFLQHHADLFQADYWDQMRRRMAAGALVDPPPFRPEHLLQPGGNISTA